MSENRSENAINATYNIALRAPRELDHQSQSMYLIAKSEQSGGKCTRFEKIKTIGE